MHNFLYSINIDGFEWALDNPVSMMHGGSAGAIRITGAGICEHENYIAFVAYLKHLKFTAL